MKRFLQIFIFLTSISYCTKIKAEGTNPLSPNSTDITSLVFTSASGVGSTFGASQEDRIYFRIGEHNTENFIWA